MDEYVIQYICDNGFKGEETIIAANSIMAIEIFKEFYPNAISVNCYHNNLLYNILERVTSIFNMASENAELEETKQYIDETEKMLLDYLTKHGLI